MGHEYLSMSMMQTYFISEYGCSTIYLTSPLRMDILGYFQIVIITYKATVIITQPCTCTQVLVFLQERF